RALLRVLLRILLVVLLLVLVLLIVLLLIVLLLVGALLILILLAAVPLLFEVSLHFVAIPLRLLLRGVGGAFGRSRPVRGLSTLDQFFAGQVVFKLKVLSHEFELCPFVVHTRARQGQQHGIERLLRDLHELRGQPQPVKQRRLGPQLGIDAPV